MTPTKSQAKPTEQTDLGIAMLIAEHGPGDYLPVAPVSTIREGREFAQDYLRRTGDTAARFKIWSNGAAGYAVVAEFGSTAI